jgi:hypothetical protein
MQLSGAVLPGQRQQLLEQLRGDPQVAESVLAGLRDPDGVEFEECAKAAVEMHLDAAFERLLAAAQTATSKHRVVALRSALALRDALTAQLVPFLDESDPELVAAALHGLVDRPDAPFDRLAALLAHDDAAVAGAAAAAIPLQPTKGQLTALQDVRFGSAEAGVAVVKTLASRKPPAALVKAWLRRLPEYDPAIQAAMVAALRDCPEAVEPEELRTLALGDAPLLLRFEAMHSLVVTGRAEADWIVGIEQHLPRQLRLLCALGLLRQQRAEGGRLLYELAFGDEPGSTSDESHEPAQDGDGTGDEPAPAGDERPATEEATGNGSASGGEATPELDAVTVTARQMLAAIAELPPHASIEAFASWSYAPIVRHPHTLEFHGDRDQLCGTEAH